MVSVFSSSAYRKRAWCGMAVVAALGLALAACGTAANIPEGPLSREVAAQLAASRFVDEALVSSIRMLEDPFAVPSVATNQAAEGVEALDLSGCVPMPDGADSDADGYPAEETTLDIDCHLLLFHFGGTLVLLDKDDQDPDSGFRSELDFRMTLTAPDETHLLASGNQTADVDAMESGAGYGLSYSSTFKIPSMAEDQPFLAFESRLTYAGILEGSFEGGTLAIDQGTYSLVPVPVDCSMLAGAEQEACRAHAPEDTGPPPVLAISSTGIAFDKVTCDTVLTGGYFEVRDDPGNVLKISYAACGDRSATYNGDMLPAPPREE